jgi:hypothetical protein
VNVFLCICRTGGTVYSVYAQSVTGPSNNQLIPRKLGRTKYDKNALLLNSHWQIQTKDLVLSTGPARRPHWLAEENDPAGRVWLVMVA